MSALHRSLVVRDGAPPPQRWVLFLHGILGSGANWRSFARGWVDGRDGWGAALVDLRLHGNSLDLPPPHTVHQAAADLDGLALPGPVDAVVGHSFGGKVALAYVKAHAGDLERAVILDSTPGPRRDGHGSESTLEVLDFLQRTGPVESRADFVDLAVAAGISRGIGQWLAMNLVERGGRLALKLDLLAIRALLEDYFAVDLWPVLEQPPGRVRFQVVLGGRSQVFDDGDRARLAALAQRLPERVQVQTLPRAGHWVHVDDPAGVAQLLRGDITSS